VRPPRGGIDMTIKLTLHDYRTDPLLPQKDGVNLAHENMAELLRTRPHPGLSVGFHDFNRLIDDPGYALATLSDVDCVLSNVGPHAHFYFWLRERLGLDFRIVRDVRTAIWSSYLHQEHLCRAYLRPTDTLLVASNYTWGIYNKMFPHLASFPTVLCYPLTACFPADRPIGHLAERQPSDDFTIGYLGRLSEDKNFPDIVELLIRLNRDPQRRHRYRLIACGDVHSPTCAPEAIRTKIDDELGAGGWFEYLPARSYDRIWDVLARFDVMIFPSTSNLETLGRVLIEASYAHVPIVSGEHAATPELVAAGGLCRVEYQTDKSFSAHFDHRIGSVDIDAMADVLKRRSFGLSDCFETYDRHPALFLSTLADRAPSIAAPCLTATQQAFIANLSVDLPEPIDLTRSDTAIAEAALWFADLQRKGTPEYAAKLKQLATISHHPERTARFAAKSAATSGDFTNVGGIDIELCHLHRFYPEFRIAPQ
jgi:glycosyltransferase involved in cell wall biosynthesis